MDFAEKIKTIGFGTPSWKGHKDDVSKLRQKKGGDVSERAQFHAMYGKEKGEKMFQQLGNGNYRKFLTKQEYEKKQEEQKTIDGRLKNYSDRDDNK